MYSRPYNEYVVNWTPNLHTFYGKQLLVILFCFPWLLLKSKKKKIINNKIAFSLKKRDFKCYFSEKLIALNTLHEVVPTWYSFHS